MRSFIRTFQPSLAPASFWIKYLWPAIFILPFALWHVTSDVVSYFRYGAPAGQIWYVLSKLLALYAALLLWYQALSVLLRSTHYYILFPSWSFLRHRAIGSLTLLVVIAHIACFVVAVSLRKQTFAWGLLLPDFRDFYHTAITVGLFAFVISLFAVGAVLLRKCLTVCWKIIHRSMILVVSLGLIHGYLIGTETRYGLYEFFYCFLMATLLVALVLRWHASKEQSV